MSVGRGLATRRRDTRLSAGVLSGVACLLCAAWALPTPAHADVLDEARDARRGMRYDEARALLENAIDTSHGDARARLQLELARVSGEPREAQRLLREAAQGAADERLRQSAEFELARLDYARGSYNSVRTRLRQHSDPSARLFLALAAIAIGRLDEARQQLGSLPGNSAALLRSWTARESGDAQAALAILNDLTQSNADELPTVLLWKAECEATLGRPERAVETAAELQNRFPQAPESVLIEPTLAAVRRGSQRDGGAQAQSVFLQLGAFEDRANALRFRDSMPRDIGPLVVEERARGVQRIYVVLVGPFETRPLAESYARTQLDPNDIEWRVTLPEGR